MNWLSLASAAVCSSLLAASGSAQSLWLDRSHDNTVSYEFLNPSFGQDDNTTFATSTSFVSGRFVAGSLFLVAEVPFAHFGASGRESENHFGNPYLGIEIHNSPADDENPPLWNAFAEIGFRFSVASFEKDRNALIVGFFTDAVDRSSAFAPDAVPLSAAVNVVYASPTGLVARFRTGSTVWLAIGEREDTEAFLLYSAQGGYVSPQVNVLAGLSGQLVMTGDNGDFTDRTIQQLGLGAQVTLGSIQPGISFRVPLDRALLQVVDYVVGITLSVNLN